MGLSLAIGVGILLMIVFGKYTKKKKSNSAIGSLIGFFLAFGILICVWMIPRRAYVVTGELEYTHYLVFGTPEYTMSDGNTVLLDMPYDECYLINDSDLDVLVEFVVYGGYGFGGDTDWVSAHEYETMPDHLIFYFFESEPPDEISVNDDSEETVRLWLRHPRQ